MERLRAVAEAIRLATGIELEAVSASEVGGGCIHRAVAFRGKSGERCFVKLGDSNRLEMFAAEADGLEELAAADALRVPRRLHHGVACGVAFLALEWLDFGGSGQAEILGAGLARLHQTRTPRFGWHRDNVIGATPQPNAWAKDWQEFWRVQRLGHQLKLARQRGCPQRLGQSVDRVMERLAAYFPGYDPVPSLLHGDLWGGNYGYVQGEPVLFDPAVYFGDREADLAMTELFGGFPPAFYAAYREAYPLDPGYGVRKGLYNLYHVLNHFNLFGGGYAAQALDLSERLLAEAG